MRPPLCSIRLCDVAAVGVLLFFGMAGSIPGIAPNQANEMTGAAGTPLQKAAGIGAQVLVNGCILLLLFCHRATLRQHARALRWAALLPLWAVLSTAWSEAPVLTLRRAGAFALAALFGMLLPLCYGPARLVRLLQITFLLLALGSALLALGFPSLGLDASTGHGGDWQGVFTQKNACGRGMVFALTAVLASPRFRWFEGFLFLVFAIELILSGSRGAWAIGLVTLAALLLLRCGSQLDRAGRFLLFGVVAIATAGAATLAVVWFADLAEWMGRDATLTGRTAIWHEVWTAILQRPLLGYGFSAFWRGAEGASWNVVVALHFVLFHAHNGFLEMWINLGLVGLALFAAGYLRALRLLASELFAGRCSAAVWPAGVVLLVFLYDLDENTLLSFNGLFFVLYAGAVVAIETRNLAAERPCVPVFRGAGFMPRSNAPETGGLRPVWWTGASQ